MCVRLVQIGPDGRFFFGHRRPVDCVTVGSNVFYPYCDYVTAAQLAVDGNIARSRLLRAFWRRLRIAQTCFGLSGGLAPINLPLFQGTLAAVDRGSIAYSCIGQTPLLLTRGALWLCRVFRSNSGAKQTGLQCTCLLLTQSGHQRLAVIVYLGSMG